MTYMAIKASHLELGGILVLLMQLLLHGTPISLMLGPDPLQTVSITVGSQLHAALIKQAAVTGRKATAPWLPTRLPGNSLVFD